MGDLLSCLIALRRHVSRIRFQHHREAEGLSEKVGFGFHREFFHRRIADAIQFQHELIALNVYADLLHALMMRSLQRIGHTQQRSELAHAHTVIGTEISVMRVIGARGRVTMVARDECDDGDVESVQAENF